MIRNPKHLVFCWSCGAIAHVVAPPVRCPSCGSHDTATRPDPNDREQPRQLPDVWRRGLLGR